MAPQDTTRKRITACAAVAALVLAVPATAEPAVAAPWRALERAIAAGEFPKTTSVLVARHGTLLYERYFGDGGPEVLNDTRSATKSVTALAVGAALADGALPSLDAPAFGFLGHLAPFAHDGAAKRAITLKDLLTMSSALDCDDSVEASPGNEERMYGEHRWARFAADLPVRTDYARDAFGLGPFHYCTAGVLLLGQVLERATGSAVDAYIGRRLFAPLGISHSEWPRSPGGEVMTGGGLRLKSRDLLTLAMLVGARGSWHGASLVPAAFVADALAPQRHANAEQDYGYLFWQRSFASPCGAHRAAYMSGNGGNAVLVFADLDAAVVVTRRNYNTRGMHQETVRLLERYVLDALCAAAQNSPPSAAARATTARAASSPSIAP